MNTVDKVIKIAEAENGYKEKKSNKQLYDKNANAGSANYTKYGKEMHDIYPEIMDFPAPWCDAYVDWCFYKAYGVTTAKSLLGGNFDDYTVESANMYKKHNAYDKNVRLGDQVFFKNAKGICHTGLVIKVNGKKFMTSEGNKNNQVQEIWYNISDKSIDGFGHPKYDIASTDVPENIVDQVIAGKWGNNPTRASKLTEAGYDPEKVQEAVNNKLANTPKLSVNIASSVYSMIVNTTNGVNLRKSMDYSKNAHNIILAIPNGTKVSVDSEKDGWIHLTCIFNGKTYNGFAVKKYFK